MEEREKTQKTQVKHNRAAQHLLAGAQPSPEQAPVAPGQCPQSQTGQG